MKINSEKGHGNSAVESKTMLPGKQYCLNNFPVQALRNIPKNIITGPRNWATSIGCVRKYIGHFEVGLIGQLMTDSWNLSNCRASIGNCTIYCRLVVIQTLV